MLALLIKATSIWILAIPPVLIFMIYIAGKVRREWSLRKYGYYAKNMPASRIIYEERIDGKLLKFELSVENTEPGHWEWFVPDKYKWKELVPEWAKDRRIEIVSRMAKTMKPSDVHFTEGIFQTD